MRCRSTGRCLPVTRGLASSLAAWPLDHPSRVAGLFLEASSSTLRGDENLAQFVETVVFELSEPVDRDFARTFITDTSTDDLAPEFVERLVEDLLKVPVVAWREMFESLSEYDDTAELPALAAPVLLVWGDADPLVPRAMQDRLLRLLPRSELAVYAGVAHTPRWEQPERVATDLVSFAARALDGE